MRIAPPEVQSSDPVNSSVLAHQPELLAAFNRMYGVLWSHGVVSHRLKEIARIRNARTTDCGY